MIEAINSFDFTILNFIRENIANPVLDVIMTFFTYCGEWGLVWAVSIILCIIFPKTRKAGIAMAVSLLLTLLIGEVGIKHLVMRARPFTLNPDITLIIKAPSGYSFPSGHTASSFAAAVSLFIFHRRLGSAALAMATFIGLSRVYMYVHYPTDVLCAMVLGTLIAFVGAFIADKAYEAVRRRISRVKVSNDTDIIQKDEGKDISQ